MTFSVPSYHASANAVWCSSKQYKHQVLSNMLLCRILHLKLLYDGCILQSPSTRVHSDGPLMQKAFCVVSSLLQGMLKLLFMVASVFKLWVSCVSCNCDLSHIDICRFVGLCEDVVRLIGT